jgi:hypothetical protein
MEVSTVIALALITPHNSGKDVAPMEALGSSPISNNAILGPPQRAQAKEEPPPETESKSDLFISSERSGSSTKACGTIGAAVGAVAGKLSALPVLGAIKGAALGGSIMGPAGAILGGVLGLGAGLFIEKKVHVGRLLGGLVGGAAGMGIGKVLDTAGFRPIGKLARETRGFTFKSLFSKLRDPKATSHQKITPAQARQILEKLQPGDIIIGNNDQGFSFEITQKLIGASGNWTHAALYCDDNTVMEVMIPNETDRGEKMTNLAAIENRPFTESSATEMMKRNHHIVIVRPNYRDRESINRVFAEGRKYSHVKYDKLFNLKSDDRHYCTEFVYKALKKGAPEINVKPSSMAGYKFITADNFIDSPRIKTVYSTGSDFWMNFLSKFD